MSHLEDIEQQYGFTFGNDATHQSADAPTIASVACTKPDCHNRGHHIQLHTDTPLPVHCGHCGGILYCDHARTVNGERITAFETTKARGGTLGTPYETVIDACTICGNIRSRERHTLPPIDISAIPVQDLAKIIGITP